MWFLLDGELSGSLTKNTTVKRRMYAHITANPTWRWSISDPTTRTATLGRCGRGGGIVPDPTGAFYNASQRNRYRGPLTEPRRTRPTA